MADQVEVVTSSAEIADGMGYLVGVVLSATSGTPVATFYDNTAGSGTKIFEVSVQVGYPVIIFFPTRFAPKFSTGLYANLGANMSATIWTREYNVIV
jgi:hypothetical protein